jgi:hypothetical protein
LNTIRSLDRPHKSTTRRNSAGTASIIGSDELENIQFSSFSIPEPSEVHWVHLAHCCPASVAGNFFAKNRSNCRPKITVIEI